MPAGKKLVQIKRRKKTERVLKYSTWKSEIGEACLILDCFCRLYRRKNMHMIRCVTLSPSLCCYSLTMPCDNNNNDDDDDR